MNLALPLLRSVTRAVAWLPLISTAVFVVAIAVATHPGPTLDTRSFAVTLRIGALVLGAAAGFVLVDPLTEIATPTPLPRWVVQWTRTVIGTGAALAVWGLGYAIMAGGFPSGTDLGSGGLVVEAVVLILTTVAVTALAARRRPEPAAAVTGAAVLFVLAVVSLPYRDVIWPTPGDPSWASAHVVWTAALLLPALALMAANRELHR